MTRDVLLVVDGSAQANATILNAMRMAEEYGDSLAIEVLGSTPVHLPALAPFATMVVSEDRMIAAMNERLATIRALTAASSAVVRVEGIHDNMAVLVRRIAVGSYLSDLVMIGGRSEWEIPWLHRHAAAALILGTGTPVLMLPKGASVGLIDHSVLCWKDCAEARRAVHDLGAIMTPGGRIAVVHICEDEADRLSAVDSVADVVRHLTLKGFQAVAYPLSGTEVEVPALLEAFAWEHGAQLVAVGAFGHSRLHELAMGSTTRTLLSDSRLPILFCR
jgi:nucleotide-binding universal stress UspA family protein